MDTAKLAQDARAMVASGEAQNLTEAVSRVVRRHLDDVAGTYTARAERDWFNSVLQVAHAQQQ